MADLEEHTPIAGTPIEDMVMAGADDAGAGAGEETILLPEIEPETPKLVLFAE